MFDLEFGLDEGRARRFLLQLRRGPNSAMASGALLLLLLLLPHCFALQMCTNSMPPMTLKDPLPFCGNGGSSCCNVTDDATVRKRFESMNISDSACATVMKSILCATCNPFAAAMFNTEPKLQAVPLLCNSTSTSSSSLSKDSTKDFCKEVWDTCKDISIRNSPFAGLPVSASKLTDIWQSETDFCKAFGGSSGDDTLCFNGNTVSFNRTTDSTTPKGICLERIGNGSYLNMAAHPDGSNRVFLSNQAGKVWLATVPAHDSGGTLEIDELNPFLDLTDQVHFDTIFGMMGLAFHPNFPTNGRFFVSYNCDKVQSASCSGRCSCNSDVGCEPSKLGSGLDQPCRYQSVVAEFTANASSATPSMATVANPSEVRRIFTMGLPYKNNHGGQILFGPADGYLYFMMGDGGSKGDPFNFAQNKKSLLGKIMRLNIDNIPSPSQINDLGLWGNYSIPDDNPYTVDSGLQAEIWALGLRDPWRCSFDLARPSYFFCADIGEDTYEEVDLIVKDGNYGWRVYEGPLLFHPTSTPGGNTSVASINPIFPIMGYTHSDLKTSVGSASIVGGYVYRSTADPCLYGRYIYADLYAGAMWAGTEFPEGSGNYTAANVNFSCSKSSPIPCDSVGGSALPSLDYIFSFGEDNNKDIFLLTSKGVYRVVPPSRCDYVCSKEKITTDTGGSSSASSRQLENLNLLVMAMATLLWLYVIA